jgi:hypothetical protein
MRPTLTTLCRTLALTALSALVVTQPAAAQDSPSQPNTVGVGVAEARDWLISVGGEVAEPLAEDDRMTLTVADQLPWRLSLLDCNTLCTDAQYTAAYSGPGVTLDWVNQWNRDHRFLKAFYISPEEAGGEAGVIVQYDVLLLSTGTSQLLESTVVWKEMQTLFVNTLRSATPPSAPATATP